MELPSAAQGDIDRLSRLLVTETADLARLDAVAQILQRSLRGCASASIALVVEDSAFTGATTSRVAMEADLVQYRHDEGPCLAAVETASVIRIDVLREDERFPHFAPGALALGVESVWSVPLLVDDLAVGSLNLYSAAARGFDGARFEDIAPLARYAAEIIAASSLYAASVDLVERMVATMEEATLLELALGRLLAAGLDREGAWAELRTVARQTGSLAAAARTIVFEGQDPAPPE